MNKNIILCGVGGQGTVLASKLIASAAMMDRIPVMSAETIGMAQKGGSVVSYIRMGENLYTPMIPQKGADIIIAFEPAEAVRMLPYLKEGGSVVVNQCAVQPVTSVLSGGSYDAGEMLSYLESRKGIGKLIQLDCIEEAKKIGSSRVVNMILLGAAFSTGELPVKKESIIESLKKRVRPEFVECNLKAFELIKQEKIG